MLTDNFINRPTQVSQIGVAFLAQVQEVQQLVDELTDTALVKEFENSKILLQKTKPVKFYFEKNHIIKYEITVKVFFDRNFRGTNVSGTSHMTIYGTTSFDINQKWELIHLTQIEKVVWHEKPTISVFKMGFSVGAFQSQIENRLKKELPVMIENAINSKINFSNLIQQFWNVQQSYKSLPQFPELEVYLKPDRLQLSKLNVIEEELRIFICEHARVFAFLGVADKPDKDKAVLNAFKYWENGAGKLDGTIIFTIALEQLSKMAAKEVKGKEIETSYGKMHIEHIHIEAGPHAALRVVVELEGRIQVKVALALKLKIEKGDFRVHIVDFDIIQASFLFKTLGKLFRKTITNRMRTIVDKTVQNQFEAVLKRLNDSLKQIPVSAFLNLYGDLKTLKITKVNHDTKNIYLDILVVGNLFAKLNINNGSI